MVGVWDGVLEVDKLCAEGVLVAGYGAHVGLAESPTDDLGGAPVVWEGDGGPVSGGGCSSGREGWGLVWWLGGGGVGKRRWRRGWRVAVAVAPDGPWGVTIEGKRLVYSLEFSFLSSVTSGEEAGASGEGKDGGALVL